MSDWVLYVGAYLAVGAFWVGLADPEDFSAVVFTVFLWPLWFPMLVGAVVRIAWQKVTR